LHGEIKRISNLTVEAKKEHLSFQKVLLRSESDFKNPENKNATRKRIAAIAGNMRLGISDGEADPKEIQHLRSGINYDGVAIPPWEDDGSTYRIYLAYQIIEPLLIEDLGPSTRLALQFHVALTLLHEFAVSFSQVISDLMLIVASIFWYFPGARNVILWYILKTIE
jgi:hypothetical protein